MTVEEPQSLQIPYDESWFYLVRNRRLVRDVYTTAENILSLAVSLNTKALMEGLTIWIVTSSTLKLKKRCKTRGPVMIIFVTETIENFQRQC